MFLEAYSKSDIAPVFFMVYMFVTFYYFSNVVSDIHLLLMIHYIHWLVHTATLTHMYINALTHSLCVFVHCYTVYSYWLWYLPSSNMQRKGSTRNCSYTDGQYMDTIDTLLVYYYYRKALKQAYVTLKEEDGVSFIDFMCCLQLYKPQMGTEGINSILHHCYYI